MILKINEIKLLFSIIKVLFLFFDNSKYGLFSPQVKISTNFFDKK
jgi:hypothetical protein